MHIFLSYASEDRALAEEVQLALLGSGHTVFFDKASLPAGGDYHSRIEAAVKRSDLFIFLISPNSVAQGSYALTELKLARSRWPHPKERLLPVRLHGTAWGDIPPYLKSVTVLEPEGSVPAEILAAVSTKADVSTSAKRLSEARDWLLRVLNVRKARKALMWACTVGLIAALGIAGLKVLPAKNGVATNPPPTTREEPKVGDTRPPTPSECQEIAVMDYSKSLPESKIEVRCPPKQ